LPLDGVERCTLSQHQNQPGAKTHIQRAENETGRCCSVPHAALRSTTHHWLA
jgi:hypothetical protein